MGKMLVSYKNWKILNENLNMPLTLGIKSPGNLGLQSEMGPMGGGMGGMGGMPGLGGPMPGMANALGGEEGMMPKPKKKKRPFGKKPIDIDVDIEDEELDDEELGDEEFEDEEEEEFGDMGDEEFEDEEEEEEMPMRRMKYSKKYMSPHLKYMKKEQMEDEEEEEEKKVVIDVDDDDDDDDDDYDMDCPCMKKKMGKGGCKCGKNMKKKMSKGMNYSKKMGKNYSKKKMSHDTKKMTKEESEFFDSLQRQTGGTKFEISELGVWEPVTEDALLPPNDPNAQLTANEPGPGEVGYAPQQRMGVGEPGPSFADGFHEWSSKYKK